MIGAAANVVQNQRGIRRRRGRRGSRHVAGRPPPRRGGQLPDPEITAPKSCQVVPLNLASCICLIGA
jgi:hypothetical protein